MLIIINYILIAVSLYSSSAVEPGIVLTVLFGLMVLAIQRTKHKNLAQGKKYKEERVELRRSEIDLIISKAPELLDNKFTYYQHLSSQGKQKFIKRLRVILGTKRFIGKDGFHLTPEVETLAAAAFVQVTFGLNQFVLSRFSQIVIYPDVFYNKLLDRNLKGSTAPIGVVRYSWRHFEEGYADPDDNINLALHELAHAIKVVVDEEDGIDSNLAEELRAFLDEGSSLRSAILEGKLDAIRKYSTTNEHEFFACCVEYFFESPDDFKKRLPSIYLKLCSILKQDPTNRYNDYAFSQVIESRYRKRRYAQAKGFIAEPSNWYQWMIAYGLFIGWLTMISFLLRTESSFTVVVLFILTVIITGLLFFTRRFLVSGFMTNASFSFFIAGGWLPSIGSFVLMLNFLIPIYSYKVVDDYTGLSVRNGVYLAVAEKSELRTLRSGVEVEYETISQARKTGQSIALETTVFYGLFGLKMCGDTKVYVSDIPSK